MNFSIENLKRRFREEVVLSRNHKNGLSTPFRKALDIVEMENTIFNNKIYNLMKPDIDSIITLTEYNQEK